MVKPSDKKIWILEDHVDSQQIFMEVLELRYQLTIIPDLQSLESHLKVQPKLPDLLIADLRLPDGNFLNFAKAKTGLLPPIVVVSSVDDLEILRSAFNCGAIEYLIKPFKKNELIVKLERIFEPNLLSHSIQPTQEFTLDTIHMTIQSNHGAHIKLTAKEFRIFSILYGAFNQVKITRSELYSKIWGKAPPSQRVLDVHLSNLRSKIRKLGLEISFIPPESFSLTHRGEGDLGL